MFSFSCSSVEEPDRMVTTSGMSSRKRNAQLAGIVCQGWMSAVIPFYVKTAYHDEPTFANTKVAMALYPKELKNILGENFKKTLEFKEANEELLKPYDDHFDLIELGKLAIDYSDGVIEGQTPITESLLKYAEDKQRPLLRYPGEDYAKAYTDFFDTLI